MKNSIIIFAIAISGSCFASSKEKLEYEKNNEGLVFAASFLHNVNARLVFCQGKYESKLEKYEEGSLNLENWISKISAKMDSKIAKSVYEDVKASAVKKVESNMEAQPYTFLECQSLLSKVVSGNLPPNINKYVADDL